MTNPFDQEDARFVVAINEEGQHSLWPAFKDVPAGWHAVFGPDDRHSCLGFIEVNWVDMRPRSLATSMLD